MIRPDARVVLALLAGALLLPLPLHVAALAAFGLPHVVWELWFLRARYGARWRPGWWLALWSVLSLQAAARAAHWLGALGADAVQAADLATLALAAMLVALAPRGTGMAARAAGAAMALGVFLALRHGDLLVVLACLAIAHNFTPVALAWDMAREDGNARPFAMLVGALFVLPLAVACLPWSLVLPIEMRAAQAALLEAQLPPGWGGAQRGPILCAIVLAQCLHYYCVIRLLPEAQRLRTGRPIASRGARLAAIGASMALLAYFLVDHAEARRLYAVAAGLHAWLEWPVLAMALLGAAARHGAPVSDAGQSSPLPASCPPRSSAFPRIGR